MQDDFGLPSLAEALKPGEFLPADQAIKFLRFAFPGPAARAFMLGEYPVYDPHSDPRDPQPFKRPEGPFIPAACDLIMGPEGSGKTTTALATAPFQSMRMPVCADGVIRAKGIVTRDNYRSLQRTTLPSWFNQFPKDLPGAHFEGGQDRPGRYSLRFQPPMRNLVVEMEVDFFGIGDASIEELLKGYEPSWGYADEADLQKAAVLRFLYGRTGRYPPAFMLPKAAQQLIEAGNDPRPRRVWGTLNPPDEDHELKDLLMGTETKVPDPFFRLHRQPSGLSDKAENRKGVSRSKYEQDARVRPPHEIQRFVHGDWGWSRDGHVVFPEFGPSVHIAAKALAFNPDYPLMIGIDQGGRPAAVFIQQVARGQIVVLDEVVFDPDHVTGLRAFAETLLDLLARDYRGARITLVASDPAGFAGADTLGGEMAWSQMLSRALGVQVVPCWTNEVDVRLEAVRQLLVTMIDPQTPAVLISPRCRRLIRGFVSKYVLKKSMTPRGEKVRPFKNEFADIQDALQYILATFRGRAGIINAAARAGRAGEIGPAARGPVTIKSSFKVL